MTAAAEPITTAEWPSTTTAYRVLWLAVLFDVLAFGVGFGWDRRWHATHPFGDFFSPPHLFVYSTHFLATLTLLWITVRPDLRRHFGPAFRLWPLAFPVPGAVAIAGAGFVVTALAGMFDAIWHTRFGRIFIAFVGIVACRIAIAGERPIGWSSAIVFGFLLIASTIERIPGRSSTTAGPACWRSSASYRCSRHRRRSSTPSGSTKRGTSRD